jgi:hypothetical protein
MGGAVEAWGRTGPFAPTVHADPRHLWNAVDAARIAERPLTCPPDDFSTVHRAHDHHQILITTFSGESERQP